MFNNSTISKVTKIANGMGVEPAALLAVAEVEAAGNALWKVGGKSLPPIRFEGHYFYKKLKGAALKKAVAQGLASPKVGGVKNPSSYAARYALVEKAALIDRVAAYESTSWGLGQVMGDHAKKLGFSNVIAMVDMAKSGVDGQIEIMARYIKKFGLVDELQSKGFTSFAKQYNGPAYKSNRYDTKMAAAYNLYSKKLSGLTDEKDVPATGDSPVKIIQRDLKRLGYYKGAVDGVAGPKTTAAVKAFQKAHGLVADGKYGRMTDDAVDAEIAKLNGKDADKSVRNGGLTTGAGAAAEVLNDQTSHLEMFSGYSDVITYIVIAMVFIGLALTLWGLYNKFKTPEEV